ncbi:MAG TPA: hypothetical protein VNT33_15035 [Telluria sp.]|nr:hypothetical protein [Telluria sp.]
MNSIEDATRLAIAGPLFDALTAGAPAYPPFALGPDPSLASYYVTRPQPFMRRGDFDAPSCMDADDLALRLARYWHEAGRPALAAKAPLVAQAAREAHALYVQAQPESEVSPYIYSMF